LLHHVLRPDFKLLGLDIGDGLAVQIQQVIAWPAIGGEFLNRVGGGAVSGQPVLVFNHAPASGGEGLIN